MLYVMYMYFVGLLRENARNEEQNKQSLVSANAVRQNSIIKTERNQFGHHLNHTTNSILNTSMLLYFQTLKSNQQFTLFSLFAFP